MKSKYERAVLLDQNRARRADLVAEMEQRAEQRLLHGDVEWQLPPQDPTVETLPEEPPATYREMTAQERAPWDAWLRAALSAERQEIFQQTADAIDEVVTALDTKFNNDHEAFAAQKQRIAELEADVLQLRATLSQKRDRWWK
jgi:hypothetical protein